MLRKLIKLLTFTDLPIRQKFLLFSIGATFWLAVVSAISLLTTQTINKKSEEMVDIVAPQEKVSNIVIRKLRGASISAHKIVLYKDDKERISNNYLTGKMRLDDCISYLNTLLKGGRIDDVSRGTGQFYTSFNVLPLKDSQNIKYIEDIISKVSLLKEKMDELVNLSLKNDVTANDKLLEYDALTKDTVTVLNEYSIKIGKEWGEFTGSIKKDITNSNTILSIIFFSVLVLSAVFSIFISRSLEKPLKAIIEQIKALSSGEIDLTKKIKLNSKDELGVLSNEFNKLMDSIEHVTSFKKVIEEDETTDDVYLRLGNIFREEIGLDNCVIYEVSNSKNAMRIVYPPEAEGLELHCTMDIQLNSDLCRAKRTGHIVSSLDYPDICKHYTEGKGAHVCIPIMIGGNVGGVVQFVCTDIEKCNITDTEKKLSKAQQYIREAQPVLEAKRLMNTLKESSFKDALTGLYNRRFLEESFENLVAGALRRGTTIGLMMCDLDFFKQTNDMYGHDVGDMVLKEAANCIKTSVRNSDLIIRFGGEEFLVLLMDIKSDDSIVVAEKIRQRIEETKIKFSGGFIQKTISIGISEFPGDTPNFWEAIKFADVSLYKAKEQGRNRAVRFSPEMWAEQRY